MNGTESKAQKFSIPETCSMREAAGYLHKSYRIIYQYVADGKLTAWRIGRNIRISMKDIAAFYKTPVNAAMLAKRKVER